mgnify:CR=1 FL=1
MTKISLIIIGRQYTNEKTLCIEIDTKDPLIRIQCIECNPQIKRPIFLWGRVQMIAKNKIIGYLFMFKKLRMSARSN